MNESLLNYGVDTIGSSEAFFSSEEKTYVVLGVSRGGTSAVAGLLNHCGVHMGGTGEAPLYEDLRMNRALAKGIDETRSVIERYNVLRSCWGFKGNDIKCDFYDVASRLRNPAFIVVFRDVFAVANRAKISANRDVVAVMQRQISEYKRIVDFLAAHQYYCVLISYEKLIIEPDRIVRKIIPHLGLSVTQQQVSEAVGFIGSAPQAYLDVSQQRMPQGSE